jgi:acetyl-CoA acetyltransferase
MDVAIIGVGLHPFGRFPGRTAIEMGASAIRSALADAGVAWRDISCAFAGSYEVDNPDAVVALLGLTGIPFHRRLQRLRHRGERALARGERDPPRRSRARARGRHG